MLFTYWLTPKDGAYEGSPEDILDATIVDWRSVYPGFRIFTDDDVEPILYQLHPEFVRLYRRIRIPACRADVARLLLLREYGGMYFDPHVGTAPAERLLGVVEKLSEKELILFDLRKSVKNTDDRHIVNFALIARKHSKLLDILITGALENLTRHEENEWLSMEYVSYNIFVLTGPYNINTKLFDRIGDGLFLKSEIEKLVHIELLDPDVRPWPVQPYKHYGYRKPSQHWSERQKTERLFEPRDASI